MAKYKDYPIYTYDEPATYSDFSGGINTDPSNEHLQPNEMRDCLNMHYSSAALVKRKGASLLCNIECEEELFNIQGVFLFTYRITYIIIAADGKLYKGFYSPNAKIKLSRLPINSSVTDTYNLFNPLNTNTDLQERLDESLNEQHEGFLYTYTVDEQGNNTSISEKFIGDYKTLVNGTKINIGDIVSFNNTKYKSLISFSLNKIYPDESDNWILLDDYNTAYAAQIVTRTDLLSTIYSYQHSPKHIAEIINNKWVVTNPGLWEEKYTLWHYGDIVEYKDNIYICTTEHLNYNELPTDTSTRWSKLFIKKELLFQNHRTIEAATYNNKMYLATGTRFVQIELINNELVASVVKPYTCGSEEMTNIGFNYLSPYPELCRETRYNQAITSITGLLTIKNIFGDYKLQPIMNFAGNETEKDYYFKWEKKIGSEWYVIYSYKDNITTLNNNETIKQDLFVLEVNDADQYQYRVSFAKSFEQLNKVTDTWVYNKDYKIGDRISITDENHNSIVYKCIKAHNPQKVLWDDVEYKQTSITLHAATGLYHETFEVDNTGNYIPIGDTPLFSKATTSRPGFSLYTLEEDGTFKLYGTDANSIIQGETYWEECINEEGIVRTNGKIDYDWLVNKVDGEYFGSATSILYSDLDVNDTYKIIQTCTKITSDGNKFLLYGDRYNSGSWYKTIINNPTYITDRGGLSFKTNKNESLVKVIPFNGTLIAFANAENVGGSIHMVTGNGDDWDDQSGYYSPYRRVTINATVSCDNADTVQVCENILVFKYFDTLYYISGSELNNEVVSVYSCNDRIKHNNNFVRIPWDDNTCISEVTEDYYALIWKEKYIVEGEDLVLDRPALKIKMYYKLGTQQNEKIIYPWLRDESDYFNIEHIVYIKGKPIYLYNNTLTTFHNDVYTDYNKIYKCLVHFRGEDLNYPKMYKLINNIMVYYHRNQYSKIDFNLIVQNEAGHSLLQNNKNKISLSDLRTLKVNDNLIDDEMRLDSTILDSKVFNTAYKFPCLLADTIITSENNKEFSISSITYNYVTSDTPDQTAYDLYSNILRPDIIEKRTMQTTLLIEDVPNISGTGLNILATNISIEYTTDETLGINITIGG